MRWKAKAAVQTVFSRVPGGEAINYLCQRRIFRNLPLDDDTFRGTVDNARRHVENLARHGSVPVGEARFYEFGAGKDLVIPLAFYCLGVNHQVLVDIRRLVRDELVVDTARRLCDGVAPGLPRTPEAALAGGDLDRRLAAVGITYRAPCDARATGLESGSVDYITSTSTLEHIPAADIRPILRESRRILAPGGRLSLFVDYQDHYSYADPSISVYNFLRFGDAEWARWSPSLQYQNRLRHRDYLAIFTDEGFEVVDAETSGGTADDLRALRALELALRFSAYRDEDLAVRTAFVTLGIR
ncbi:MAG: class I SAM-dependent methyltransferase [Actinomycetota bacterium]|nr:class I SAM-dependent methyltransferase [Actinomycetota bacterium]